MMPMTTTCCRSRVRLLPLVAVLAVAASLEPLTPLSKAMAIDLRSPLAAAKGAASVVDEAAHSSFDEKLKDVKDLIEHGKEAAKLWSENKDEVQKQLQLLTPGAGGSSPSGSGPVGYVVDTGNIKSLVHGIDINSPVTRTGPCEVGARAVSCSAPACRQLYDGQLSPNCVAGAGLCPYPYADDHFLYQGKTTLFTWPTAVAVSVPLSVSVYACSPSSGGAVLGLGRSGTLARTVRAFTYELSDLQGDAIRLGAGRAQRQRGQGGKPTPLISNPMFPNRYYVQITGILVGNQPLQIPRGALDIQQNGSGGVYLSTTMPVGMYLNGEVYELLKAALQNKLLPVPDAQSLCYSADATITLVFAGDAVMALQPGGAVWRTRKDGARCLAVWPSGTGETILGTRAQMGRLMTYELAADNAFGFGTVTF